MHPSIRQIFVSVFLLLAGISGASAQQNSEYIFPSVPFNEAEVSKQMEDGTSSISGVAKLKKKGVEYVPGKGDRINLYPVTPYLLEFSDLQKKHKRGKKVASMSNEAFTYRIEGRFIDNNGTFEFKDLKPGKYYIVTWIEFQKQDSYREQTGSSTTYNMYGQAISSSPLYTRYTYNYTVESEVSSIVEVKADGEKVTTILKN
jgi:hypothetical protein